MAASWLNDGYPFPFWTLQCLFFTMLRFPLKLLAIHVEKHLRWWLQACLVFAFTEKVFLCLTESYCWDKFWFNQSINFSKGSEQNSFDFTFNKSKSRFIWLPKTCKSSSTRFFIINAFIQLSLSAAYLSHELSFKCFSDVA